MNVELLSYTPDGEKLIAAAAKLCYSPTGIKDIMDGLDRQKTENFLNRLVELGHESPIEHISFTFGVEGVSRTLSHQLVRHRIASYSQQSQRYVRLDSFDYIVPPSIREDEKAYELFKSLMETDRKVYCEIAESLKKTKYERYLKEGCDEKSAKSRAEKEAIEDARYIFPNACETKIVFTMNARSLMNFFRLRTCTRAQWEIRAMAIEMLKLVKEVCPILFKNAGPSCVASRCSEGKMSCMRQEEMRKFFKEL